MPKTMTRLNRALFNPVIGRLAGKVGPLATLIHRGRTSGTEYRTPILAFPAGNGFVIALVYGRDTDWQRNVLDAGGCELLYQNASLTLTAPQFIGKREAEAFIPPPIRWSLRLMRVDGFVRLDQS